jgi:hypothetical protein
MSDLKGAIKLILGLIAVAGDIWTESRRHGASSMRQSGRFQKSYRSRRDLVLGTTTKLPNRLTIRLNSSRWSTTGEWPGESGRIPIASRRTR